MNVCIYIYTFTIGYMMAMIYHIVHYKVLCYIMLHYFTVHYYIRIII